MFEQDYIMQLIANFMAAIRRSIEREEINREPMEAAKMLDEAVGDAVDLDPSMLLNLAPESAAGILQVSGTDSHVIEYSANSLLLASTYYAQAGKQDLARLRAEQARAIADSYGFDLPDHEYTVDDIEEFLSQSDDQLGSSDLSE